jgi:hypothetical protein
VIGSNNKPVPEGARFAVDVQNAERGFVCYKDGCRVAEVSLPVASDRTISPEELPDHGPHDGMNGWSEYASAQVRSIDTGDEALFKPTSQGGRAAIGALLRAYGIRLDHGKTGFPIVELRVISYKHRLYGLVYEPRLHVVDWFDQDPPMTGGNPAISGPDTPTSPLNVMPNAGQSEQAPSGDQEIVDDPFANLVPDYGVD